MSKQDKCDLDKVQAKFVKCIIGIGQMYKTTPLLEALNMHAISKVVDVNSISLLNNIMKSHSAARTFNFMMLRKNCKCPHLLINRVKLQCMSNEISFIKAMCDAIYVKQMRQKMLCKTKQGTDGTVDSIRTLCSERNPMNMSLLRLLLKAF